MGRSATSPPAPTGPAAAPPSTTTQSPSGRGQRPGPDQPATRPAPLAPPTGTPRPDRPEPGLPDSLRHTLWVWPALATLAVTLFEANRAQLWRDELATWSVATRPTGDLVRVLGHIDAVTGPYYLLMHGWIRLFGDSVLSLRLPSVLATAGAAALLALLGERLLGARAGLVGGLLFAVVPSTSRYAQEARPYAFAGLFAVLATLALVGAVRRPGWWRWIGYAAAVLGLGLSHLIALSLLAGHAALILLARRPRTAPTGGGSRGGDGGPWRPLLRWLVVLVPTLLLLTPLALVGRGQQGRQLDWVDPSRLGDIPVLPGGVLQGSTVGGLVVGLALVGGLSRGRRGLALGLCALLPAVLLYVGGLVSPLWVPRYLVFTVPFLCLLAGAVLAGLRMALALVVVLAAGVVGVPEQQGLRHTHEWPRSAEIDYRGAAEIIAVGRQPGDGIVYSPRTGWKFLDLGIAYQLGAHAPRDVLAVRGRRDRADLWVSECPQPASCLAPVSRVWVLVTGRKGDPLQGMPAAKADPLRAGFDTDAVWHVPGLTLALLTRRGT